MSCLTLIFGIGRYKVWSITIKNNCISRCFVAKGALFWRNNKQLKTTTDSTWHYNIFNFVILCIKLKQCYIKWNNWCMHIYLVQRYYKTLLFILFRQWWPTKRPLSPWRRIRQTVFVGVSTLSQCFGEQYGGIFQ